MIKSTLSLLLLSTALLISCTNNSQQEMGMQGQGESSMNESMTPQFDQLIAVVHPTATNNTSGSVRFIREGGQVRVVANISGLEPNSQHGFHIHQYGDCSAEDGTSAGGHFNPMNHPHAGPDSEQRHVGDLGNLESNENGVAELNYRDPVLTFSGASSILGRGLVVHAGRDDMESQPTGDAGSRIGCGVIGVAQTP